MTLHIFNPEHDLALAASDGNFTAPHAGRQLRADLGYLPLLWAKRGDLVLVNDKEWAWHAYTKLKINHRTDVHLVTLEELPEAFRVRPKLTVTPWGWDPTIREQLRRAGVPEDRLPGKLQVDRIRDLSNRRLAVNVLDRLKELEGTTGFSRVCNTYEELLVFLDANEHVVVKAPWSSSGRGVRYIDRETALESTNTLQWICNTIKRQGSVTAEIYCDKVQDFAVEFVASPKMVQSVGFSIFNTVKSAYTGNVLDAETEKVRMITRYVPLVQLDAVVRELEKLLYGYLRDVYEGPLGVDMMVVKNPDATGQPYLLNPCVEINLRCTMGHAALALTNARVRGTMHIEYDGKNYKLKLNSIT